MTVTAALMTAAVLTGCTTTAEPATAPTGSATARPAANTDRRAESGPAATGTTPAAPATTAASTGAPSAPTATATAAATALAQHVHDECSTGAAAAGVRLAFTEDPDGYTAADGSYQLVYPFTFVDGHEDPYAVFNCVLTDDTVTSEYVSSGLSDTH